MSEKASAVEHLKEPFWRSGWKDSATLQFFRRYARNTTATVSLIIVVLMIALALFAPYVAPRDPVLTDISNTSLPPAGMEGSKPEYIGGTDNVGRDVFSRALFGARFSLVVALPATMISLVLGGFLGLVSGYRQGTVDTVVMRFVDMQRSLPLLVVAIAVMSFASPGVLLLILLLGFWGIGFFARLVRGDTLAAAAQDYVQAARAIGMGPFRIMFLHILPNVTAPIVVLATFMVPQVIIVEASLSFLGMGVPPPAPSWGNLLAEGRDWLQSAWWMVVIPGFLLVITVLSFNLAGDRLRDVLDPFLRKRAQF